MEEPEKIKPFPDSSPSSAQGPTKDQEKYMDEASSKATGGKDHSTLNLQVLLQSRETRGSLREKLLH